ncbi:hypothetical protein [Flavobacterium limnophilum]|uniref:hypothetical protein n=1 Tax=Flavobacterium limnophilum TaxID=3003262 RepID=UPI002482DFAF|nr:hypothetical protein [Flavobacterium limnophilum]
MSLTYFKSKFVCVFLVFAFLLQSCAVYQKTHVSIDEAVTTENKVLIIKTDDTKLKLKKIEQIDGVYYGIIDGDREIVKVPLNKSEIKTIRILDKSTSTLSTIAVVVVPLALIIIFATVDWGPGNLGLGE